MHKNSCFALDIAFEELYDNKVYFEIFIKLFLIKSFIFAVIYELPIKQFKNTKH